MSKVLAVAASARRGGNSDAVLERALAGIKSARADVEVETIIPCELSITPCRSCNGCWNTGRCVVEDGMQEVYGKFTAAHHVVLASPIYFTSLPGHLKVMIDRFQCFWALTYRLGRPPQPRRTGMFLCVGAMQRERYFQGALTIVKTWLSTLNVACPVSRFYSGVDAVGDVLQRRDYLDDAFRAGAELMELSRRHAASG